MAGLLKDTERRARLCAAGTYPHGLDLYNSGMIARRGARLSAVRLHMSAIITHPTYDDDVTLGRVTQLNAYMILACSSVLVYDTLSCLDMEVRYIWQRRWSVMKVLYLWTRYSAFSSPVLGLVYFVFKPGHELTPRVCSSGVSAAFWLDGVGISISELVLAMRIWAFWGRKPFIAAIAAVVYAGFVSGATYTLYEFFRRVEIVPIEGHPGCFVIGDGTMARLLLVVFMIAPPQISPTFDMTIILCIPGRTLYSVLIAHLVLHVKAVADPKRPVQEETDAVITLTTFRFAEYEISRS
ncbi:hypothetical protein CONPUDRAFT_157009 [Coniophora puteana RWD-64-598 SS2]|uniref:DUF6533 domain-containing protein n=1 Tax=Coniophora puteana (strain RWD-64-598) TaxID=741705 RepID=A0A5M3MGR7_CONPW|nr:uncharacterized protein CONPUDRAFT_157009 [Coniophora puteana RWD-64-598 SS2]EIW77825.1 hypothetical protein CONPUDRAFT_157009 [Coniophora puteana RWD-64-598 SS2]